MDDTNNINNTEIAKDSNNINQEIKQEITNKPKNKRKNTILLIIILVAFLLIILYVLGIIPIESSEKILENVNITGYLCNDNKCTLTLEETGDNSYNLNIENPDIIRTFMHYEDYVKLDIYYKTKGWERTVTGYKATSKKSNEDISSVRTEKELREKLNLFTYGINIAELTLSDIGEISYGTDGTYSYKIVDYFFKDESGNEYKMEYEKPDSKIHFTIGEKYNVTFEVVEGKFEAECKIISVEQKNKID